MKENLFILSWFLSGSGEKISPLEIDAVLLSHPAVSQAFLHQMQNMEKR